MRLIRFYKAECPKCGLYRFIEAESAYEAFALFSGLGWSDVCVRCTEIRKFEILARFGRG